MSFIGKNSARMVQQWNSSKGWKNRKEWLEQHGGSFEKVNKQWKWVEPVVEPVAKKVVTKTKKTSKKKGV